MRGGTIPTVVEVVEHYRGHLELVLYEGLVAYSWLFRNRLKYCGFLRSHDKGGLKTKAGGIKYSQ